VNGWTGWPSNTIFLFVRVTLGLAREQNARRVAICMPGRENVLQDRSRDYRRAWAGCAVILSESWSIGLISDPYLRKS